MGQFSGRRAERCKQTLGVLGNGACPGCIWKANLLRHDFVIASLEVVLSNFLSLIYYWDVESARPECSIDFLVLCVKPSYGIAC